MTQPPATPDPAAAANQVSELEKQLADAAAQVARIQAELSQARAADPDLPDVPVPYAGDAPVVMINGRPVPAGQAVDVSAMLGAVGSAGMGVSGGGSHVVNIPPVVTVNGQVVTGGAPVDLSSFLGPDAVAQIRSSLDQLGLGGQLAGLFGPAGAPTPPAPGTAYATTPGEVAGPGNRALAWLAAVVVLGLLGVIVYLVATT